MKFTEYEKIRESLDRPAQITSREDNISIFTIGDMEYRVVCDYNKNKRLLDVQFMARNPNLSRLQSQWSYDVINGDSTTAMTVFATVVSEVRRFMNHNQVDAIRFESWWDSNQSDRIKRERLYKRMAVRFAKELDFDFKSYMNLFVLRRRDNSV